MSDDFVQAKVEKKKLPPLNKEQIEYAHELLEELHPLEKTPLREAFPWLGVITCYNKQNISSVSEANDNEAQLLGAKASTVNFNGKEIKKRTPKKKKNNLGDKAIEADPLAKLGFGIVAYMGLLWTLIWSFIIYSLLLIPTMSYFGQGTAYANVQNKSSYLDGYLGNMGYSSVQCTHVPLSVGQMTLSCPYGTPTKILSYGVNPNGGNKQNCMAPTSDPCQTDRINIDTLLAGGKIALTPNDLYDDYHKYDPQSFSKQECISGDANFFAQFTCEQDPATQALKYDHMSMAVASGILICLLFTISIRMMYQGDKIQQLEWDMSTITAGDYTIEFPIKAENYAIWKREHYRAPGGPFENHVAPALALKQYMIKEIETKLDRWVNNNPWAVEKVFGQNKQYGGTKVADIVFSFDNARLINALRKRGGFIASQNFDKMREEEVKINELFQEFDSLTVPTAAFITFESDDSKNFALLVQNADTDDFRILNQPLDDCNPTSEPTDIIWENRHFTNKQLVWRQVFAYLVIAVLIFASFIVVYLIFAVSSKMANVYPTTVDCPNIIETYGSSLPEYAQKDYDFVVATEYKERSSGCLQCFCNLPENSEAALCESYLYQTYMVLLLITAISYFLIGFNYVLRTICIMLIDWVGFSTETMRLQKTTTVTFVVQFINSAFLSLMASADMSEQPISFGLTIGQFPDFNSGWFRSVGEVLVASAIFNVYYPILEVAMYWGLRVLFRCLDRGCCRYKTGTTKSTSIQGYISVYQGPLYYMHYKYSSILCTVYITFMYGFGMPILFPIAMLSFLVLWVVEKLYLFYGYIMPPMYDERLSQDVLSKLQFAPLLYLCFGYWMASNQQLLSNDHLGPVASSSDVYVTNHTMWSVFSASGWGGIKWPMLVCFIFLNLVWYFGNYLLSWMFDCFPSLKIGDVEINEDIDNYWASLDEEDRKWSTKEEENARVALKTKILTDSQYQRLKSVPMTAGKTLQGCHSYDILANPLYLDDFQYVTAAEDDRAEMIIDDDDDEGNDAAQSDLVRISLNLAYMNEDEAHNFQFNKSAMKTTLSSIKINTIQ